MFGINWTKRELLQIIALETKIDIHFASDMCQCAKTDVTSFESWSEDFNQTS